MEHDNALYIPLLVADHPGSGALTGYLDHLEEMTKLPLKIPNVLNARLAAYLIRRGWKLVWEFPEQLNETVGVYVFSPRQDRG